MKKLRASGVLRQNLIDKLSHSASLGLLQFISFLTGYFPSLSANVIRKRSLQYAPMSLNFCFQSLNALYQIFKVRNLFGANLRLSHRNAFRWIKSDPHSETTVTQLCVIRWQPLAPADALDIAGAA